MKTTIKLVTTEKNDRKNDKLVNDSKNDKDTESDNKLVNDIKKE